MARLDIRGIHQLTASEVAGHDYDSIREIHQSSLSVRQTTVVQNLQKHVEDIGMSLLDLIEQHD